MMWAQITQHYEMGSFINSGRDGTILRRARHLGENVTYAMKIIPCLDVKVRIADKSFLGSLKFRIAKGL